MVGTIQTRWRIRGEGVFHHIEPTVRPEVRRGGLGRALLAWAERHIAEGLESGTMGPLDRAHVLAGWADLEIEAAGPFVVRAGYQVDGYRILMARLLDRPIPDLPLP